MNRPKVYSYIRFSSGTQTKGSSLERQTEAAEKYAQKHGLPLDIELKDLATSGFTGKHREKGAFGSFLRMIEEGKIAKGSVFMVENQDRFSREEITKVLPTFMDIINAGIKIVFTVDGREYTKESINNNWSELIFSLSEMARANAESKRKSKIIQEGKDKRREKIEKGEWTTKQTPFWLRLVGRTETEIGHYELIPDRVAALKKMFEYRLQGLGINKIMDKLNEDKTVWQPEPTARRSRSGWYPSDVNVALRSCSAYGAIQLRTKKDGKMVNDGEPIENHFPKVISKSEFDRVQTVTNKYSADRSKRGGGSKMSNVFVSVVKCSKCGASLVYNDHGGNCQNLACTNKLYQKTCDSRNVRYTEVYDLFFREFEEMDLNTLLPKKADKETELQQAQKHHLFLSEETADLQRKIKNGTTTLLNADAAEIRDILVAEVTELKQQLTVKEKEVKQSSLRITELTEQDTTIKDSASKMLELKQVFEEVETEEAKKEIRAKIRYQIQTLVERIEVTPLKPKQKRVTMDGNIIETRMYKTLYGLKVYFTNNIPPRLLVGIDRREAESTSNHELTPNRLDRKPKYS